MKSLVRTHSRKLPSGRTTQVKQHRRGYVPRNPPPFTNQQGIFKLPIRTAIIVPSTSNTDEPITQAEMNRRVEQTRVFLSKTNGGFTSVKAVGGYTDKDGKVIKEPVVIVESYSERNNYIESRKKVRAYLEARGKAWKQEAMGYEHENDLYYVDAEK